MTWQPPWGKAEIRCDWRDSDGHRCKVTASFDSNGSHIYDRNRLAGQGWTYGPLAGDLCPAHGIHPREGEQ